MKKVLRWVWSFVEFIIIVYVILLTSFLLCKNKYGYTQFGDYTFNNIDLLDEKNIQNTKNGDLLIVKNSNDINNGDVIYYYAVYNDMYIVKSGVVTGIKNDDYSSIYTVDDGGPTNIVGNRVLGKYATTYSRLGSVLSFLESRLGFLFCVLLPILIVFIYQVYEFVVIIRYERVEKDKLLEEGQDVDDKKEEVKQEVKEEAKEEIPEEKSEIKPEEKTEDTSEIKPEEKTEVKEEVPEVKPEEKTEVKEEVKDDDIEML